jgi:hypothetical protein
MFYDNDIIGLVVCDDDKKSNGVAEADLPALFTKAKQLLAKAGITEEPKLYSALYHSY